MNRMLVKIVHKSRPVGSSVFAIFFYETSYRRNSLSCGNRIWWITTPASSLKTTKDPPKKEILSVTQTGAILRCYFLLSSWCQRSPLEKVQIFLPLKAPIFSQTLESSCSGRPTSTGTRMAKDRLKQTWKYELYRRFVRFVSFYQSVPWQIKFHSFSSCVEMLKCGQMNSLSVVIVRRSSVTAQKIWKYLVRWLYIICHIYIYNLHDKKLFHRLYGFSWECVHGM